MVSGDMNSPPGRATAWTAAAALLARWLGHRERIDRLMEQLPSALGGAERARCQHLVYGVVRHAGRIEAALDRVVAHPPRFGTRAMLFLAGFELIEDGADTGRAARIVHHAVGQAKVRASAAEGRLVNAVARKLSEALPGQPVPPVGAPATALAEFYSHPAWLVHRWLATFGATNTHALLEWNQRPAPVYTRFRGGVNDTSNSGSDGKGMAPDFQATTWPGYFEVPSGRWAELEPLLRSGRAYVQDPSARLAVELLAPAPGEWVLDACAAPGGKSLLIADALAVSAQKGPIKAENDNKVPNSAHNEGTDPGALVALDLPGERMERLQENMAHAGKVRVVLVPADLRTDPALMLRGRDLPVTYPAVLVDAPCTNSGVMRHRIDVKWRLQSGDFQRHALQQRVLLEAAAHLVAPRGRLVYSTCSLDPEENEGVVAAFLERAGGQFTLAGQILSKPWESGHDGAGAFLLRRRG
jgi:16S rRNA (cytosine967-C5)-methyltransferase